MSRPTKRSAKAQAGADWKLLTVAVVAYGVLYGVTTYYFVATAEPLPASADASLFSEGRAREHLHELAEVIGHRQVGSVGEEQAAQYILREAQKVAAQAAASRPDLLVEAVRESVSGGITMHAFKFELANVYRNLTNVVLRISPTDPVAAAKKAVLVNSHYDSTLGTKGASDACSCICIELELARTLVANPKLQLAAPVVFLFNGGEETLSQASNGFFASSRFARDLGAFINLESTGPWGPDVVFQHTGDWTLAAYARSAPHPRGTTLAQDFFDLGLIPADTDYRMFSYRHYGSLPGIDIAFIFDGTAYHTARDEVERIRAGTLQDMGENVLAAIQEFARVLATDPPAATVANSGGSVYFDLWGRSMVIYSHAHAKALHHAPLAIVLLLPLLGSFGGSGNGLLTWLGLCGNALLALASVLCALLLPALLGAGRAYLSGVQMVWYGRPQIAYTIYLPGAAAGLMLPYVLLPARRGTATARSVGAALLFAAACSALTSIGMHSSFFYGLWAAGAAVAAALSGGGGTGRSWGGATALLLSFLPAIAVAMPSAVTFLAHVMEKVGLAGGAPGVLGLVVADTALGVVAGATALVTFGTLVPYLVEAVGVRRGRQLAAALLALSLTAAGVASAKYRQPYSRDHPKRLLVQHIHKQGPDGAVVESKLSVVGLDSFSLMPVLPPSFLQQPPAEFLNEEWQAFYPLNNLISSGEARSAPGPEPGAAIPALRLLSRGPAPAAAAGQQRGDAAAGVERLEFELDTGKGGAWGVMNFTGGVLGWSLSDKVAEVPLPEGGVAHMVRFAANMYARQHRFWLDVAAGSQLAARVYVKHVEESAAEKKLLAAMPDWASPAAVVAYHSRWQF